MCGAHFAPCVLASLGPQLRGANDINDMLNPLRSEGEAFRALLYVLVVFLVLVAVVLVVRAL